MTSVGDWCFNLGAGQTEGYPETFWADLGEGTETVLGPLWAVSFNTMPGVSSMNAALAFRAFGAEEFWTSLSDWFGRHRSPWRRAGSSAPVF
jgi:hypothetical protein